MDDNPSMTYSLQSMVYRPAARIARECPAMGGELRYWNGILARRAQRTFHLHGAAQAAIPALGHYGWR